MRERNSGIRPRNRKRTDLESVLAAREKMHYVIEVPDEVRIKAKRALDRMPEIA